MSNSRRQGRYWLLTIPRDDFQPWDTLKEGVAYLRGQREIGHDTNYHHWQLLVALTKKGSLSAIKKIFGDSCHAELTRSEAAYEYVWKEDTRVDGTQFEIGKRPLKRNEKRDWAAIWSAAKSGSIEEIDPSVLVCHYTAIRKISYDFAKPISIERRIVVYWGDTGAGKSRRAWEEAGLDAYPKDPRTKFWDGYRGQEHVVIDEFRGDIDIAHILRWTDRYPVIVEVKGSAVVLKAHTIWITSNLSPSSWYPTLDDATEAALQRRLSSVEHFTNSS